jgi:hypothetical protein
METGSGRTPTVAWQGEHGGNAGQADPPGTMRAVREHPQTGDQTCLDASGATRAAPRLWRSQGAPAAPAATARGPSSAGSRPLRRRADATSRHLLSGPRGRTGPHRAVADRTLAPHRQRCARCVGTGLIGERSGFRECPSCEGGGGIWAAPEAVLAEAYRSVVASFPDMAVAGALSPAIPFPVGGVAGAPRVVTAPVDPARRRLPREEFRSAFLQAEAELGTEWELKGRGHVPRATIRGPYSHVTEVTSCWQCFNPSRSHGHRFVFPLAVIERAAAILGVPAERIISRKY